MKAVFLDCNGVISEEREDYIKTPEEFVFLPRSIEAIRLLNKNNFLVVITSNQAGVPKGKFTLQDLDDIHKKMIRALKADDAKITNTYYCIHFPECENRKPNPGMLNLAAARYGINTKGSYMVGDRDSDMKAGKAAGCTTFFVETGHGNEYQAAATPFSDYIVKDLMEAAERIIELEGQVSQNASFSDGYELV